MEWLQSLTEWLTANRAILWWLFAGSLVLFLLTPICVVWLIVRLPPDYFVKKRHRPLASWDQRPVLRLLILVAKNLLGIVLLIAGLVMLLAPGQGVLTIIGALILIDFPGKFRLERWLVTRQSVWRSINWLRKRAGRAALQRPA